MFIVGSVSLRGVSMSCGTCGEKVRISAANAVGSPLATGAVQTVSRSGASVNRQYDGQALAQVMQRVSRPSRQRMWERTATCPDCGARISRGDGGACPLCDGTGSITWDGEAMSSQQLRESVIDRAKHGMKSYYGYLWVASHFPDLAQDLNVQRRIRAEVKEHPTWALWGHAPDMLVKAGLGDVVREAAAKMPDAARVSLRALAALSADRSPTT